MSASEQAPDVATAEQGGPAGARAGAISGLDSSAALVRAESAHLNATLHGLVRRLGSIPSLALTVTYRQGRLRRLLGDLPYLNDLRRSGDPIEEIVATVGEDSYWLRSSCGAIACGRDRGRGGLERDRERLAFHDWATALCSEIERENLLNHEALLGLRRLVEQDAMR
jgi:hypothetical protein